MLLEVDNPGTNDFVEDLSISEIAVYHMLGKLTPQQARYARNEIVPAQIVAGEDDIHDLYLKLRSKSFNPQGLPIRAINNFAEYFSFLWDERPEGLVDTKEPYLTKKQRDLLYQYKKMSHDPSIRKEDWDHSLKRDLVKRPLYLEVACKNTDLSRRVALISGGRKDTDRVVRKIAGRIIERIIGDSVVYSTKIKESSKEEKQEEEKRPDFLIDDIFRMKVVTYHDVVAHQLVEEVYKRLQKGSWGFVADTKRSLAIPKGGGESKGFQLPGLENHYLFGKGEAHFHQIKLARPESPNRLRELAITDVVNFLIDEMEHLIFEGKRARKLLGSLRRDRTNTRRYETFVKRGDWMMGGVPMKRIGGEEPKEIRRRIFDRDKYFEE